MKASKFIVLVGGIVGLLAFFLPLIKGEVGESNGQKVEVSFSAFKIIKGVESINEVTNAKEITDGIKKGVDDAQKAAFDKEYKAGDKQAASDLNKVLDTVKPYVAILFIPTVLFLLVGGIAVKKGRFGRGGGAAMLLVGLVGLGLGALVKAGGEEHAGIAATLVLASGAAGFIGGLLALVKPDRG